MVFRRNIFSCGQKEQIEVNKQDPSIIPLHYYNITRPGVAASNEYLAKQIIYLHLVIELNLLETYFLPIDV